MSVVSAATLSSLTSAAVLEEVVVTAQKREQNLQDVSVAVTAFSGNALRELNMTNSVDIAGQTPGLNIGTPVGEGNNPSITLRGVGLNDFNDNNEGPIAVYRDEIYQSAMPGLTFQLFDMERVEVLRGPQGTLYGRNATGGLVHFISKKPTKEMEGY
ncbi:MAG: TonB-dependent receptor, partial [Pseudomonadales bacterium]|nr:TonB-dependent receptor [Pseudomonadales bacterium]